MSVNNAEIARLFERVADLLEIEDANPFRIRAYRNAARTIRGYSVSMVDFHKTHFYIKCCTCILSLRSILTTTEDLNGSGNSDQSLGDPSFCA